MIALQRGRELALLQLVGGTRRQVRSMARWEAALIVTIGVGLGLAIAAVALLPLSHVLTGSILPYVPLGQLAAIIGVVGAARSPGTRPADASDAARAPGGGDRDQGVVSLPVSRSPPRHSSCRGLWESGLDQRLAESRRAHLEERVLAAGARTGRDLLGHVRILGPNAAHLGLLQPARGRAGRRAGFGCYGGGVRDAV